MSQLLEFIQTHEEAFRSRIRLASLYSDFGSQRSTNPDGFNANASAWLRALKSAADAGLIPPQSGDRYVLHTGEELASSLNTKEHGRPLALGVVIDEAVRKKELVPLKAFLEAKTSVGSSSWIPTPWQVVQWGLRQIGVTGGQQNNARLTEGDLVILSNVEVRFSSPVYHLQRNVVLKFPLQTASQTVLKAASTLLTSNASRIFSPDLFKSTFAPVLDRATLSHTDYTVLLTHLSRDLHAVSFDARSGYVKIPSPSSLSTTSTTGPHALPPLTPDDLSIGALRTLISDLETQVTTLTTRISTLDAAARSSVSQNHLVAAKSALRQKKAAETALTRRSTELAQLEDVFAALERAADQLEMVRVLKDAGRALKGLNERTGGVEAVQEVVEGMREEMGNVEEIGRVINEVAEGEVDEGEVEEELERLETVERERKAGEEEREKEEREKKNVEAETEEARRKLAELNVLDAPKGEVVREERKEEQMEESAA